MKVKALYKVIFVHRARGIYARDSIVGHFRYLCPFYGPRATGIVSMRRRTQGPRRHRVP